MEMDNKKAFTVIAIGTMLASGILVMGFTKASVQTNVSSGNIVPVVKAQRPNLQNVSAIEVIKNYVDSIGGSSELNKVLSIDATMTMIGQNGTMSLNEKKLVPNKDVETITLNGIVIMKSVFDGTTGYELQMDNKRIMTADEISQKKVFSSLTEQLDYINNPSFRLTLKGIQKIDGNDAYQIDVIDPTGKISTDYYDVESKLLVKNESTDTSGGKTARQIFEISDYRKVGNIKLPFKSIITEVEGGQMQRFILNVTDVKLNAGVTDADFK